jgi:hypothetical protein
MHPGQHVLQVVGVLVARGHEVTVDAKSGRVRFGGDDPLHATWEAIDLDATTRWPKEPTLENVSEVYASIADWLEGRRARSALPAQRRA